jgi:hypothetical protein
MSKPVNHLPAAQHKTEFTQRLFLSSSKVWSLFWALLYRVPQTSTLLVHIMTRTILILALILWLTTALPTTDGDITDESPMQSCGRPLQI